MNCYTFNRAEAKENVIDNLDLLKEACEKFDCKTEFADKFFNEEWEWMDVTIRCYLLGEIVETVVEEERFGLQNKVQLEMEV